MFSLADEAMTIQPVSLIPAVYRSHDKATSRIIIRVKPRENATVARLVWFPSDISGISSSTTTYIIAPAAKESRYGRALRTSEEARMVSQAPTGSTSPDSVPSTKERFRLTSSECSGIEMMAPSGKFWMAMQGQRKGTGRADARTALQITGIDNPDGHAFRQVVQGDRHHHHHGP